MRVVKHRNGLLKVPAVPSLKVFKARVDGALSKLGVVEGVPGHGRGLGTR